MRRTVSSVAIRTAPKTVEYRYELPVPATYVVDKAGVIRFVHVDVDYMTGRAEPEAIVTALKALSRA